MNPLITAAGGKAAHMRIGGYSALLVLLPVLVLSSCLSTNATQSIDPPWLPEIEQAVENLEPPKGEVAPVFWLEEGAKIDGDFSEWNGLVSASPHVVVYGGGHVPSDASGDFTLATDGSSLFIYVDITDDVPNENKLPPAGAWRSDSVEIFFGTDTSPHQNLTDTDNHLRLVPVSKTDPDAFSLAINDVDFSQQTSAAVKFREDGYQIEAEIPLTLLNISDLEPGQKVRVEFQINDGDSSERDRLIHWMGEKDNSYYNAAGWGDGEIVPSGEETE